MTRILLIQNSWLVDNNTIGGHGGTTTKVYISNCFSFLFYSLEGGWNFVCVDCIVQCNGHMGNSMIGERSDRLIVFPLIFDFVF